MSFINKIMCLAVVCTAIGGVVLAWQNHAAAPEISLLVLGGLCILALAGAIVALSLAARARQETAKLSLLVENAVDRLERRHDGDHARLVMTLAALDARSSGRNSTYDDIEKPIIINKIEPTHPTFTLKTILPASASSGVKEGGDGKAPLKPEYGEQRLIEAITAKKLPLSLQPIFEMPSAEVRGYIAFAQVDGRDIRRLAEKTKINHMEFDYQLLFAAAKAARQILSRVPVKSPLFCSVSGASLGDQATLNLIVRLFEAQPVLKEAVILLVASEDIAQIKDTAFETLRRLGVHVCLEGIPTNSDNMRYCDGGYWFVNAPDSSSKAAAEFKKSYGELIATDNIKLVALEGSEEAQIIDLIDLKINLLTSAHLSPPRLVRDT